MRSFLSVGVILRTVKYKFQIKQLPIHFNFTQNEKKKGQAKAVNCGKLTNQEEKMRMSFGVTFWISEQNWMLDWMH